MPFKFNPFTGTLDTVNSIDGDSFAEITQPSHGLSVGQTIYFDGSLWQLANSASIVSLGTGIVSEVIDANIFKVTFLGEVSGLSGLTTGNWYYVSDTTPGALSLSPGVNFSNPILYSTSTTTGIVYNLRADSNTATDGLTTRSEYNSTASRYLYTGSAARGTLDSDPNWKISRFDFEDGSIEYADSDQLYDNIWNDRESLTYG